MHIITFHTIMSEVVDVICQLNQAFFPAFLDAVNEMLVLI